MRLREPHFCAYFLDFRAPLLYPAAMSDLDGSADIPVERTPLSELNARAERLQELGVRDQPPGPSKPEV